jgi:hypothetical protein
MPSTNCDYNYNTTSSSSATTSKLLFNNPSSLRHDSHYQSTDRSRYHCACIAIRLVNPIRATVSSSTGTTPATTIRVSKPIVNEYYSRLMPLFSSSSSTVYLFSLMALKSITAFIKKHPPSVPFLERKSLTDL